MNKPDGYPSTLALERLTPTSTGLAPLPLPPEPPSLAKRTARLWWRDNAHDAIGTSAGIGVGVVPPVIATLLASAIGAPTPLALAMVGAAAVFGTILGVGGAITFTRAAYEAMHGFPPRDFEENTLELAETVDVEAEPTEVLEARARAATKRASAISKLREAELALAQVETNTEERP